MKKEHISTELITTLKPRIELKFGVFWSGKEIGETGEKPLEYSRKIEPSTNSIHLWHQVVGTLTNYQGLRMKKSRHIS